MRQWIIWLFCGFASSGYCVSFTTQQTLIKYIDHHYNQYLSQLTKSIDTNSGTHNLQGVRKVAEQYQPILKKLGFKTRFEPMPKSMGRGGHLIAERHGHIGKKLLLIGHLDTVFEQNDIFQAARVKQDHLIGPGAIDMKGGNSIILSSLQALDSLGGLKDRDITVFFIGDEESAGQPKTLSRGSLMEAGKKADIALGYESAHDLNSVVSARRGVLDWTIQVTGISGHSSLINQPAFGQGAILGLSQVLTQMQSLAKKYHDLTFNPGLITGGSEVNLNFDPPSGMVKGKENIIASKAVARGEIRYLDKHKLLQFQSAVAKLIVSLPKPLQGEVKYASRHDMPSMRPTEKNHQLRSRLSQINQQLGLGPVEMISPRLKGGADIAYVASPSIATMDGLGGVGDYDHSSREYMNIAKTRWALKRNTLLMAELLALK